MAEAITPSGPTAVTDRRPVPRGVLPRHIQTWVMASVAAGMVAIMFVVGRPNASSRSSAASTPSTAAAPTPDRLREYQDRLRLMEVRAAQEAHAAASVPATMPDPPAAPSTTGSPSDPLAEDRKRRAYESLFASNVVLSRRPAEQQPIGNGAVTQGLSPLNTREAAAAAVPPNLDDVANAVVRATARAAGASTPGSGSALALNAAAAQAPTPAAPSTAATSPKAEHRTPTSTDPITDAGPLHRLLEGTVIDTVLTNRLDGATASPVNCLVTNPIYSHSGEQVLIPAGSRVLGETKAVQSVGESRLAVAFHRLLFPDGRTVSLDHFIGLNALGDAALSDQVNHHYGSTFGAAAAVGLISGLGQDVGTVGFSGSGNSPVVIAGGLGNATSEATAQVMNHFLNRLPTITIREGHRVKVYLTGDLELPAYDTRPLAVPATARVP